MNREGLARRSFLRYSLASFVTLPRASPPAAQRSPATPPLKIICVGAHPDDPESGCGGTLARYTQSGHQVTIIYLTRGEINVRGKSHDEAAAIRTAEAETACKIIGARPVFAGQIDGATELNNARAAAMLKLLSEHKPDVVFTHWPVDTNPDHQVAALLALRCYVLPLLRFQLYFFEVNTGTQTMNFKPTHYVDITPTREKKKAALFAHKSQDGERIYREHHEVMERFRGREAGIVAAEAFINLERDSRSSKLPGL
jgi:LmbE family N-acetylglucosaminyl deacetylase